MSQEQIYIINNDKEKVIIKAIEAFKILIGMDYHLNLNGYQENDLLYGGLVDLLVGKANEPFRVEIKSELRANRQPASLNQQAAASEPFLLICQYIPMLLKKEFKKGRTNYLEAAVNCSASE